MMGLPRKPKSKPETLQATSAKSKFSNSQFYEFLIDEDLSTLTEDDIDNLPMEQVVDRLRRCNIDPHQKSDQFDQATYEHKRLNLTLSNDDDKGIPTFGIPRVEQPSLVDHIADVLKAYRFVSIFGPSYYGKTFFVTKQILKSQEIRQEFPECTKLDFLSLRVQSSRILERDAVWKLFGAEEDSYRQFMYEIDGYKKDGEHSSWPLREYLLRKYKDKKGLIVLDHVDHLPDNTEISNWFRNFINFLSAIDISVILIQRAISRSRCKFYRDLPLCYYFRMPLVDKKDIASWLDNNAFIDARNAGVTCLDVVRSTGCLVGVLHDFGAYLINYRDEYLTQTNNICDLFREKHSKHYSRVCFSLVQTIRADPSLIKIVAGQFNNPDKECIDSIFDNVSETVKRELIATGAFQEINGRLEFICPSHRERFRNIIRPDIFLISSSYAGDLDWILENKSELPQEILRMSIRRIIFYQENTIKSIEQLLQFLRGMMKFPKLYVRDVENSSLWFRITKNGASNESWHLSYKDAPSFTKAVQSGRIIIDGSKFFVPVISQLGGVDIVLKGEMDKETMENRYKISVFSRSIVGYMWGMERIISSIAYHYSILRRKLAFEGFDLSPNYMKMEEISLSAALRMIGCYAVIVFDRERNNKWSCQNLKKIYDNKSDFAVNKKSLSSNQSTRELDRIVNAVDEKGYVIEGKRMKKIFPKIYEEDEDAIMFLMPVSMLMGKPYRIVAFLFEGQSRSIKKMLNNDDRRRLTTLAPYASDLVA